MHASTGASGCIVLFEPMTKQGQCIPDVSHSWSRACEPTGYLRSSFQSITAAFARDQGTPKPLLDSAIRDHSIALRARARARAIPLLNQYLPEPGSKKPACPKSLRTCVYSRYALGCATTLERGSAWPRVLDTGREAMDKEQWRGSVRKQPRRSGIEK